MIVTSMLSVEIVRYLNRRTESTPHQWTTLDEVADNVYGSQDLAFRQAVDLARCRGWIVAEGQSPSRRACLTKAGCLLVLSDAGAADERTIGLGQMLGTSEGTPPSRQPSLNSAPLIDAHWPTLELARRMR